MSQPPPQRTDHTTSERSLSVDEARAAMLLAIGGAAAGATLQVEPVVLAQAAGRVLAGDVISPIDVPQQDTAAMDGWAFDGRSLGTAAGLTLREVATLFAGGSRGLQVNSGECVRIMTGAAMPAGCDTVLPLEMADRGVRGGQADQRDAVVRFTTASIGAGANCRRAGEDIAAGTVALSAGRLMTAADLGLLASLGGGTVGVRRRLKVALFSTGDELVPPGQPAAAGQIHDSNRIALAAALLRLGLQVQDEGAVRDDPQALEAALRRAVATADVVVTSGGVSAGDADHTRAVLARLGTVAMWKVAMRPGRPFAFGQLRAADRSAWLFALPGNPVAAMVSLWMLAREPLLRLAGAAPSPLVTPNLPVTAACPKRIGRTEFVRAVVEPAATGGWQVRPCADQGASAWRGLAQANALIVLSAERGAVAAGDQVPVCLFEGLS